MLLTQAAAEMVYQGNLRWEPGWKAALVEVGRGRETAFSWALTPLVTNVRAVLGGGVLLGKVATCHSEVYSQLTPAVLS